jgi:hypothetical protein
VHRKERPQYGPCPTCGKMFESRYPKRFCSMNCYVGSPEHKAAGKLAMEAAWRKQTAKPDHERYNREHRHCLECDKDFAVQPAKRKKFCSHACYRVYMAKRFDRWIANPQRIALPQAYDEFLTSEELPCLVAGCEWVGQNLSCHMNLAHGVPADEFKRAAGFNLSTGVVSLPTHQALVDRAVDYASYGMAALATVRASTAGMTRRYRSKEAGEHFHKARAMAGGGPTRVCDGCGKPFVQSTPYGRAKFCTTTCRDRAYARRIIADRHEQICAQCTRRFSGSHYQARSAAAGAPVFCSASCRAKNNAKRP